MPFLLPTLMNIAGSNGPGRSIQKKLTVRDRLRMKSLRHSLRRATFPNRGGKTQPSPPLVPLLEELSSGARVRGFFRWLRGCMGARIALATYPTATGGGIGGSGTAFPGRLRGSQRPCRRL